jgi:hypothetical protein
MIWLDVADLVVIAGQTLDIGADAVLSQFDIAAAQAALAEARLAGQEPTSAAAAGSHRSGGTPPAALPHRADAAAAGIALVHALLRHPLTPGHGEQVAVAAGLQFLAVNGWQADLDVPRAAATIIRSLASGQLSPAGAASWLAPRLSPHPESPARRAPMPALLPPGSRARRIMSTPVAAVRRRRSGPGPFVIIIGSDDKSSGIRTPVTGLVPFTGPARDLVVLSAQEARRRGQPRGPEHILLSMAGEGDGVAVKALERLGISQEAVRQQAGQITGQGRPQAPPGRVPDTPPPRRMWHAALDEAVAHGHDYIGTEHFLLALFCDSDGAAAQALARLGAREGEVRGAIAAVLAESGRERSA